MCYEINSHTLFLLGCGDTCGNPLTCRSHGVRGCCSEDFIDPPQCDLYIGRRYAPCKIYHACEELHSGNRTECTAAGEVSNVF